MPTPRDVAANLVLKRPARKLTYADLAARLERDGQALVSRAARTMPSDEHRRTLRHIIGIERWGQRRLRTILGEPPATDEYDAYQPDPATDWPALREALAATRRETITCARQLAAAGINDGTKACHNDLGALTGREWLRYLTIHARVEAFRLR